MAALACWGDRQAANEFALFAMFTSYFLLTNQRKRAIFYVALTAGKEGYMGRRPSGKPRPILAVRLSAEAWRMLREMAPRYGTQTRVIELALEVLYRSESQREDRVAEMVPLGDQQEQGSQKGE